jgi:hypothetical protein
MTRRCMTRRVGFLAAAFLTLSFASVARADDAPDPLASRIHAADAAEIEARTSPASPSGFVAALPAPLAPRLDTRLADAPTVMKNRGLFYAGLGTGAAGIAVLAIGLSLHTSKPPCRNLSPAAQAFDAGTCAVGAAASDLSGLAKDLVIGLGGAMMVAGLTMGVVGGWQVPLTPAPKRSASLPKDGAPVAAPPPRVSIVAGPTAGALRVTF